MTVAAVNIKSDFGAGGAAAPGLGGDSDPVTPAKALRQVADDLETLRVAVTAAIADRAAAKTQIDALIADAADLRTKLAAAIVDRAAAKTQIDALVVDIAAHRTQHNALAAKLDADATVTDTNYAATTGFAAGSAAAAAAPTATAPSAATAATTAAPTAVAVAANLIGLKKV